MDKDLNGMPLNGKSPDEEGRIFRILNEFIWGLFNCDHFVKHFRTICMMHLKFLKDRKATKNSRIMDNNYDLLNVRSIN